MLSVISTLSSYVEIAHKVIEIGLFEELHKSLRKEASDNDTCKFKKDDYAEVMAVVLSIAAVDATCKETILNESFLTDLVLHRAPQFSFDSRRWLLRILDFFLNGLDQKSYEEVLTVFRMCLAIPNEYYVMSKSDYRSSSDPMAEAIATAVLGALKVNTSYLHMKFPCLK